MSDLVRITKEKVQRYLTDLFGSVSIDRDGDFYVRNGSTMVFISVVPGGEKYSLVRIFAPVLREVPESPACYKYVATANGRFVFGSLSAREAGGKLDLMFGHALLGEYLDPEELSSALSAVAITADAIDDEIKAQFGGVRFNEP